MSRKGKRQRKSKAHKITKRFSWHFWFINVLTLLALLLGYSVGESNDKNSCTSALLIGGVTYFSPWFLYAIRNWMPRELMLKFYKKT